MLKYRYEFFEAGDIMNKIEIGKKNGCLRIEKIFDLDNQSEIIDEINELKRLVVEEENPKDKLYMFKAMLIDRYNNKKISFVKCVCKCGNIIYIKKEEFEQKTFTTCGLNCDKKRKKEIILEEYKDGYYEKELPLPFWHETLYVDKRADDLKQIRKNGDGRKRDYITISKQYRCKCYLCGKEYLFTYPDFEIRNDYYGVNATKGYYSKACCDCHPISSFQWRTIYLLKKHNVNFLCEYPAPNLYGVGGKQLRFDFVVFDANKKVKYIIECQGQQHYEASEKFGGEYAFERQQENDNIKREFAKSKNIPFIEVSYKLNTIDKEEDFLMKEGVFNVL